MQTILAWIKERGLRAVNLHASAEGRGLYEKLGFGLRMKCGCGFDVL